MKLKDIINNPDNYELEEHTDGAYLIRAKKEKKGDTPEAGKLYVLEEDRWMYNKGCFEGDVYSCVEVDDELRMMKGNGTYGRDVSNRDRWRCIGTIEELMKKAGVA